MYACQVCQLYLFKLFKPHQQPYIIPETPHAFPIELTPGSNPPPPPPPPPCSPSQPSSADGEPHPGIHPPAGRHAGCPGQIPQPGSEDRPPHRRQHPLRPGCLRGEHGDVHAPTGKPLHPLPLCLLWCTSTGNVHSANALCT